MNKRNQEIVSDEALVAHLKKNYIYDARRGVVVNRKLNRVVKGSVNSVGYVLTHLRIRGTPKHKIAPYGLGGGVWQDPYTNRPHQRRQDGQPAGEPAGGQPK